MSVAVVTSFIESHEDPVLKLLRKVSENSKETAENQLRFSELHENIVQLENLIFSLDQDEAGAASVLQGLSPEFIAGLNHAYSSWETQLEHEFANRLIRGDVRLSDYPYYERSGDLVRSELALADSFAPHRILFIGSGPLPMSAVHLHLQTGVPVDVAVRAGTDTTEMASRVLEKCGLNHVVRVIDGEAADFDASNYGLVVVGVLAKPKKNILHILRKHRAQCPKIFCRTVQGVKRLAYEPITEHDLSGFHLRQKQPAGAGQLISTWLLEPAAKAATDVRLEWLSGIDSDTAAQLLRLVNRTLEEETTIGYPGPIDQETGFAMLNQLHADVEAGHRHVLVAYKDETIVGQVILTPNASPNHRHIVELTRGTIHPSFRGGGLPLRAFYEVARKCEELGREVICLDVRAGTHAAVLWQYFGFKQYGSLADYARIGDKKYQGLYMTQTTEELKQRLNDLAAQAKACQKQRA